MSSHSGHADDSSSYTDHHTNSSNAEAGNKSNAKQETKTERFTAIERAELFMLWFIFAIYYYVPFGWIIEFAFFVRAAIIYRKFKNYELYVAFVVLGVFSLALMAIVDPVFFLEARSEVTVNGAFFWRQIYSFYLTVPAVILQLTTLTLWSVIIRNHYKLSQSFLAILCCYIVFLWIHSMLIIFIPIFVSLSNYRN